MTFAGDRTETIPVTLEDGTRFKIEVVPQGREDVSFGDLSFEDVAKSIEGVLRAIVHRVHQSRYAQSSRRK